MQKRIYKNLSKIKNLVLLNGILIAIIIGFNLYFQAFCIPTTWAILVLTICFANTILYPIFENTKWAPVCSFINGISLFVFVYCVLFLEYINFLGLIFILLGIGLVTFIPHFFVIQLIWKNLVKPVTKSARYYFSVGVLFCMVALVFIGRDYNKAINSIQQFKASNYKELDKNFMTEKSLECT